MDTTTHKALELGSVGIIFLIASTFLYSWGSLWTAAMWPAIAFLGAIFELVSGMLIYTKT